MEGWKDAWERSTSYLLLPDGTKWDGEFKDDEMYGREEYLPCQQMVPTTSRMFVLLRMLVVYDAKTVVGKFHIILH